MTANQGQLHFAHTGERPDRTDWHLLHDHLLAVGELAKRYATEALGEAHPLVEAAEIAGWLHDLGKYRPGFQAHLAGRPVDLLARRHKEFGSLHAAKRRAAEIAFAIHGHHGGLSDKSKCQDSWKDPRLEADLSALLQLAEQQIPALGERKCPPLPASAPDATDFFTRFLFSCLVDADWTDTAAHELRSKNRPQPSPSPKFTPEIWLERLLEYVTVRAEACPDATMRYIRGEILQHALQGANLAPGHFSLTVPTGGGKTLSSLAFALRHAIAHRDPTADPPFRRVIYVAPYLSIIDQNVNVIRDALQLSLTSTELFEHHSLARDREKGADGTDSTADRDFLRQAERWNAPLIVTTNVQFFESLFANQPGTCRKIHNIARSIIILDECHLLPPGLLAPTLRILQRLVADLGCSIVLCSATQPTYDAHHLPFHLSNVRELMPPNLNLAERLQRVRVVWPNETDSPLSWSAVATQMLNAPAVLSIVNTRAAAKALFNELSQRDRQGLFHLSTTMCPAHRRKVIDTVGRRLRQGETCRLVSTQLIEAGVDLDFPVVMREFAPFVAVVQAAGRCNREGLLGRGGGMVHVFRSEEGGLPHDAWYRQGVEWVWGTFHRRGRLPNIDSRSDLAEYLGNLYHPQKLDQYQICDLQRQQKFASVADNYRLIDEDGVAVVVLDYDRKHIEPLLKAASDRPCQETRRALAPFQVNFRFYELSNRQQDLRHVGPGLLVWDGPYDHDLGVVETGDRPLLLV